MMLSLSSVREVFTINLGACPLDVPKAEDGVTSSVDLSSFLKRVFQGFV